MWRNTLLNLDCVEGIRTRVADDSVDIIIADPPYGIGKDFGNRSDKMPMDAYLNWCDTWIEQCVRVLSKRGTLYIYGISETLAFVRTSKHIRPLHCRWLVWHYTNRTTPHHKHWQRSHESILCVSKTNHPIFNRDDVREPYTDDYLRHRLGRTRKNTGGRFDNKTGNTKETVYTAHEKGALLRDVIKIPALSGGSGQSERIKEHPTQKPLALADRLIRAVVRDMAHPADNRVLIPFCGTGTEIVCAQRLGLSYMAFEINPSYVALAKQRLEQDCRQQQRVAD